MLQQSYQITPQTRAQAELERRSRLRSVNSESVDWRTWLKSVFPTYVTETFSERHVELWGWVSALEHGVKPRPFCAFWPRGGAKSTTAEFACAYVGYQRTRFYVWYVSSTQDKADKHVANIGGLLESKTLRAPLPGTRKPQGR